MQKSRKMKALTTERTDFLQGRRLGIGGSDIAAILGLNKYRSALQVYNEKVNGERSEDNMFTIAGRRLEKVVVEYFEEETGYMIVTPNEVTLKSETDPFVCSVDRFFSKENPAMNIGVLETKTTQKEIDPLDLPKDWFCQTQWYMGMHELKFGAIAWLERGIKFNYKEIDFVPDFYEFLKEKAREFWNNHILTGIPPEPRTLEDILSMFPDSSTGKKIEASESMQQLYGKLKDVRGKIKTLEQIEEDYAEQVKVTMRDAEVVEYLGEPLFTWKSSKPSTAFDDKKLKAENEVLYNQYAITKPGSRRFLIK